MDGYMTAMLAGAALALASILALTGSGHTMEPWSQPVAVAEIPAAR